MYVGQLPERVKKRFQDIFFQGINGPWNELSALPTRTYRSFLGIIQFTCLVTALYVPNERSDVSFRFTCVLMRADL